MYSFNDYGADNCFIPNFSGNSIPFVTEDLLAFAPDPSNKLLANQLILDVNIPVSTLNEILDILSRDQDEDSDKHILVVITDMKFKKGPKKVILVYISDEFTDYKFISKDEYKHLSNTLYGNIYELWVPYYYQYKYNPKYFQESTGDVKTNWDPISGTYV